MTPGEWARVVLDDIDGSFGRAFAVWCRDLSDDDAAEMAGRLDALADMAADSLRAM